MKERRSKARSFLFLLIAILPALFCGPGEKIEPVSPLDSPEVHYNLGMKKVDSQERDAAVSELQRAIALDPKYSPAYGGLAIVSAMEGDGRAAAEYLEKAKDRAKSDEHKIVYHTAAIRVETALKGKDWLDHCKSHYEKGVNLEGNRAEITYFYGLANEDARSFDTAVAMYRKVIELNSGRVSEADSHWKAIQRVMRAQPGSKYGKEMALKGEISRGELAVLLLEELDLEKFFNQPSSANSLQESQATPYDVRDHPLKNAIEKVLGWHLRGLDVIDNLFHPDQAVTRGEFAMLVEDIIIKESGDLDLATRYISEGKSPFQDIDNTSPYYNAVMVATSRGLIEPASPSVFDSKGKVSGSEVLLAIRKLKEHRF